MPPISHICLQRRKQPYAHLSKVRGSFLQQQLECEGTQNLRTVRQMLKSTEPAILHSLANFFSWLSKPYFKRQIFYSLFSGLLQLGRGKYKLPTVTENL